MIAPCIQILFLVEDGRGANVIGSLPIVVTSSNHPPVVEAERTARIYPGAVGIAQPTDPDGDRLTVTIPALPSRGLVRNGAAVVKNAASSDTIDVRYYRNRGFGPGAIVGGLALGFAGAAVAAPYYYNRPRYYDDGPTYYYGQGPAYQYAPDQYYYGRRGW